jgi:hypothetical protein
VRKRNENMELGNDYKFPILRRILVSYSMGVRVDIVLREKERRKK